MHERNDILTAAAAALRDARSVAVLTGAGVSAESGLSTFRDAQTGHWAKYDPMQLATPEAFRRDPELVTRWYDMRRQAALAANPNDGHRALAEMQRTLAARDGRFTLITQNVDGLHARAGSTDVIELHGSLRHWRCFDCGRAGADLPSPLTEFPTPCDCGGYMRPGVVWFGESLPTGAIDRAAEAAASCDVFLTVGTSAVVYPAAGLIHVAHEAGARTIEINRDATDVSELVTWRLAGPSGDLLPHLMQLAFPTD
ncbi:MAG: NAD-dependent deacylase [Phycisphaerales bacterium]